MENDERLVIQLGFKKYNEIIGFYRYFQKLELLKRRIMGTEFLDHSLKDKNQNCDNWFASRVGELLDDLQRTQPIRVLREGLGGNNDRFSTDWVNDRTNSKNVDCWKKFFDGGLAQVQRAAIDEWF